MSSQAAVAIPGIHVLAKPIGSICDIACECFYLEKRELYPRGQWFKMPDEVLAKYIEQCVAAQPTPVVEFVRHGGRRPVHSTATHLGPADPGGLPAQGASGPANSLAGKGLTER